MTEDARDTSGPVPFRVEFTADAIDDLRTRLPGARWPDRETVDDWSQGVPLAYLREVCTYWATDYDFTARNSASTASPSST